MEDGRDSRAHVPWIDALTAESETAVLAPLIALAPDLAHLRVSPPAVRQVVCDPPAWNPELECLEAYERRLQQMVAAHVDRYRREAGDWLAENGYVVPAVKVSRQHFAWLARRQLFGWPPAQIANRYRVSVSNVHAALAALSRLLELPLRPVKKGRPGF